MLSKQGNKNFYKGKGAKKGGQITNRGKVTLYVAQFTIKNPFTIIAPDLTDFKVILLYTAVKALCFTFNSKNRKKHQIINFHDYFCF